MTKLYAIVALALITVSPQLLSAQAFEDLNAGLEPLYDGRINWSDLDNDGDLDILYSGLSEVANVFHTRAYENNAGTFVLRTTALPDLRNGEIALGDYDKDGDPDVLLSGLSTSGNITQLYDNNGAFGFSMKASFTGLMQANPSWADIDNDEDLDFIVMGAGDNTDPSSYRSLVYRNDGSAFTLLSNTNLPPCSQCAMDWADANNDGWIDVAITTVVKNNVSYTELYLNNRNSTFTLDATQSLPQLYNGDVQWGDFDRDGNMDLLVSGVRADGTINTEVYQNNRGKLQWMDALDLYYVGENWHHGTQWVDYNNDGLLDIVLSGRGTAITELEYIFKAYKNLGDSTFVEDDLGIQGLAQGSVDFGDFDNDGDIDIVYMGITADGIATGILKNKLINGPFAANTKPLPPNVAGLTEKFYRKSVTLRWADGTDTQTPTDGLSYNFWLQQGAVKTFVPASNLATGFVLATNAPNGHAQSMLLSDLTEGSYTWAVQTIDGAHAGSLFTTGKSFYQLNGPEVLKGEIVDGTHIKLTWRDHSAVETSYRVERSTSPMTGFAVRATPGANAATYTDNFAFVPETRYYYRVSAVNATKTSAYDSLMVVVPAKPETVDAREVYASRILVMWDDMSEYESGYVVERRLAGAATFAVLDTLDTDALEFLDTGLAEGTDYEYRVRAINAYGYSAYSDPVIIKSNFRPRGADIAKAGTEDTNVTFTEQDFSDKFTDQDVSDNFMSIVVANLPQRGSLKAGATPVVAGQRVLRNTLNTLVYTPAKDDNGTHQFDFYYNDGKDTSDVAYTVSMELAAVNDAPQFTIPAKLTLVEDFEPMSIVPVISIPADEQSQTITWSISPTEVTNVLAEFDAGTGTLKLTPVQDAAGSWQFTITANDGQNANNTHSATVDVVVSAINDAPFIAPIDDIAVEKAQPVPSVTLTISDPDSPAENIVLGVTSDNQAVIKNSNLRIEGNTLHMTPELKVGKAIITVRATDGISIGTRQFTLEIMTITAVEDFAANIDIYPNPVERVLNISMGELRPPFKVIVSDAVGRNLVNQVVESSSTQVDFTDIKTGMYFIKVLAPDDRVLYQGKVIRN